VPKNGSRDLIRIGDRDGWVCGICRDPARPVHRPLGPVTILAVARVRQGEAEPHLGRHARALPGLATRGSPAPARHARLASSWTASALDGRARSGGCGTLAADDPVPGLAHAPQVPPAQAGRPWCALL